MNIAELAEMKRLQAALAAAQAGQPAAQAQPGPSAVHHFHAQAAPAAAVHTVGMPFPIDTQGMKFVPSLPTWVIWLLSVLVILVFIFSLIMTSVLSSKTSIVASTPVTSVAPPAHTLKVEGGIKIDFTGLQLGKP